MKKALKIITYVLFVLGFIALIVCYITIPNETKSAIDIVVGYMNTPLPIIGISIIALGIIVYKILSMTTIGKKGLGTLKSQFTNVVQKVDEFDNKVDDKLKALEQKALEQKALLTAYQEEIDKLTDIVIKVCETSPNVKIKAIGENIKPQIANVKEQTIAKLEEKGNELAEIVNHKLDFEQLSNDYNELKDMFDELKELVEKNYGERKDSNSNEE